MAGNTKLMGFGPDINNPGKYILKLARWGGEVVLETTKEMVAKLGAACRDDLPTKPTQSEYLGPDFKAGYDPSDGSVTVKMSIATAKDVAGIINYFSEVQEDEGDEARYTEYSKNLHDCVQAHRDFLNATGEPGVENTD